MKKRKKESFANKLYFGFEQYVDYINLIKDISSLIQQLLTVKIMKMAVIP